MSRLSAVLVLLTSVVIAASASAQMIVSTSRGVVVAHDGRLELHGRWSVEGVRNPTALVAGQHDVAVIDALANVAVVVDLATGARKRIATAETPIAGAFSGRELYILARDARVLQHGDARIDVAADPTLLRVAGGKVYVYARTAGRLHEIEGDAIVRETAVDSFASDFEISGQTGYLLYPGTARVLAIDLAEMKRAGEVVVGAVPTDMAFAGGGTAITARILAVTDPSSKRVWLAEATQSTAKAVARGFLRGLLGLGLFGNRSSQFPTGVDRVEMADGGTEGIAYDSSTGTLYRFSRKKSSVIATGVAPGAFALTPGGVAWWNGTSVAQTSLR